MSENKTPISIILDIFRLVNNLNSDNPEIRNRILEAIKDSMIHVIMIDYMRNPNKNTMDLIKILVKYEYFNPNDSDFDNGWGDYESFYTLAFKKMSIEDLEELLEMKKIDKSILCGVIEDNKSDKPMDDLLAKKIQLLRKYENPKES